MLKVFSFIAILGGVALPAGPVSAQTMIDGTEMQPVLDIFKAHGSAEVRTTNNGEEYIRGRAEGIIYTAFFYKCDNPRTCNLQLVASWSGEGPDRRAKIDRWNNQYRFIRARMADSGSILASYDINLAYGVSSDNLDNSLATWRMAIKKFSDDVIN